MCPERATQAWMEGSQSAEWTQDRIESLSSLAEETNSNEGKEKAEIAASEEATQEFTAVVRRASGGESMVRTATFDGQQDLTGHDKENVSQVTVGPEEEGPDAAFVEEDTGGADSRGRKGHDRSQSHKRTS